MAKKHGDYLANDPDYVPDPEIEEFMELEISRAPKDPDMLAQRLRNNTAASPRDAGGDLDANWLVTAARRASETPVHSIRRSSRS